MRKQIEHSPTPWRVEDHWIWNGKRVEYPSVVADDGWVVAFLDEGVYAGAPEADSTALEAKTLTLGHAHLIKAAPELLAACKLILQSSSSHGDGPMTREEREVLIRAIAKAESRTP